MHVLPAFHLLEGIERFLDRLVKLHEHFLFLWIALGDYCVGVMALHVSRGGFSLTTELANFGWLLRLVEDWIAASLRVGVMHRHGLLVTTRVILGGLVRISGG